MLNRPPATQRATWRDETARARRALLDPRLVILLILAPLVGLLAYQAPATSAVAVGWPGDRLFLRASEGQGAADALSFYGDEITGHARSGRSRWTHAGAAIRIPGLGPGDLEVTIRAQGWPDDVLRRDVRQPQVEVLSGATPVGSFTPSADWADVRISVPAAARAGDDLQLELRASAAFTGTARFADARPKGLRVEQISVRAVNAGGLYLAPATATLALLTLAAAIWLLALLALSGRPNLSFLLATLLVALAGIGLALARGWAAALMPWAALLGALALAWALRGLLALALIRLVRAYGRGEALTYGLFAAAAAWLIAGAARLGASLSVPSPDLFGALFPDSLLYGLLGIALLSLVIVRGRSGLPDAAERAVQLLGSRAGAASLLALLLLIWGGYLASVIAVLPYVGHADYADNAVVARNLLSGRGWVVDYVTQFYRIYPGITRPQETWPLLQPAWIAPFFAALGPSAAAAKIPNLIGVLALGVAIYLAGARLWDRRVGLVAATITLTSHLFFKLVIYVTSDLLFVLFTFGALALLYLGAAGEGAARRGALGRRALLGSAILTGLMLLQKPGSGGVIAVGMGLWLLRAALDIVRAAPPSARARQIRAAGLACLLWGAVALALVAPLVARNMATFGKLYYTTESHDAWVLEYTDWDRIYAVYAPELGGDGVPDRSWVLRWGFDRTQIKIARQIEAVRDYLIPAWPGLPPELAWLAGRADRGRLLFEAGAWLTLLGALGALGTRRRLMSLLLLAFGPYTAFLVLYWHSNEERYFVAALPWLALLAAAALWRSYDRLAAIGDRRWAPLGLTLVLAALWLVISPSWQPISEKVRDEPQLYAADLDAYAWLRERTEPGAVMMTRSPWQLNWHADRPALMIPYTTDRDTLLRLAQHYQVRYLVLDTLQRPEPEVRQLINAMLDDPQLGFREVYRTPIYVADYRGSKKELSAEIYAFPDDYGGVPPLPDAGR